MNALNGLSGKLSIMRVLTSFVVVTCMLVWVSANIISFVNGTGYVGMDTQAVALIIGVLGAKAAQRYGEGKIEHISEMPFNKTE